MAISLLPRKELLLIAGKNAMEYGQLWPEIRLGMHIQLAVL